MKLEKLTIRNLEPPEASLDPLEFKVLFNPSEYTIEEGTSWEEQKRVRKKPGLQYTGRSLKKISMELFLDTYERKEDVRQYTREFARLLIASVDTGKTGKRPPRCQLIWGPGNPEFQFDVILESLRQQFVLFLSNGTPVRAKLSVSFKEYIEPELEEKKEPQNSSFPTKTYTVKASDTLSSIAGTLWQNSEEWRRIAKANQIKNPRKLMPGQVLIIPAIED